MRRRVSIDPSKVIDLVINKDIPTSSVAERFGCNQRIVSELLKRYGYEFHQANKTWVRRGF